MARRTLSHALVGIAVICAAGVGIGQAPSAASGFQVDPLWPKPLPNHWILGSVTGVAIDSRDHIWLAHRGLGSLTLRTEAGTGTTPPTAEDCCAPAPPILEFDPAGNLVGHWGGPGQGFDWPVSPGGIAVDAQRTVWIAAAGAPDPVPSATAAAAPARAADAHVLAFSGVGLFIRQIGKPGEPGAADSSTGLDRPADVAVDSAAGEIYVADGGSHQRIIVFDAASGGYKRQWRGHGTAFARLTCVSRARDGQVYVCDRKNNRIQVFKKDGTFVNEAIIAAPTSGGELTVLKGPTVTPRPDPGLGSMWDATFSADAAQQYLFVADGQDQKILVLRRDTLQLVASFGAGGRWPGHFYGVGSLAVDSKGNLYTGETYEGKRLQKFIRKAG